MTTPTAQADAAAGSKRLLRTSRLHEMRHDLSAHPRSGAPGTRERIIGPRFRAPAPNSRPRILYLIHKTHGSKTRQISAAEPGGRLTCTVGRSNETTIFLGGLGLHAMVLEEGVLSTAWLVLEQMDETEKDPDFSFFQRTKPAKAVIVMPSRCRFLVAWGTSGTVLYRFVQ